MAIRELPADDEQLDPIVAIALLLLSAIMATGVMFAVLITTAQ
jgi:hypothetical protein